MSTPYAKLRLPGATGGFACRRGYSPRTKDRDRGLLPPIIRGYGIGATAWGLQPVGYGMGVGA